MQDVTIPFGPKGDIDLDYLWFQPFLFFANEIPWMHYIMKQQGQMTEDLCK